MPSDQDAPAPGAASPALVYDGRISELYGIFIPNLLLTIITFGIYRFWAITRLRRYMWAHMRFQGDRFEYTGTGGELFLGFILALTILIGLGMVTAALAFGLRLIAAPLVVLPILVFYALIFVLAFAAVFSAQRYRLNRTLWRGIRGGMHGSAIRYGLRSVLYFLLNMVTLYQMTPWMTLRLTERRLNASSFGNLAFGFRGRARRIYLPFLAQLLVFVVLDVVFFVAIFRHFGTALLHMAPQTKTTDAAVSAPANLAVLPFVLFGGLLVIGIVVGMVRSFYVAALAREVANHSTLGPLRFASTIGAWALLRLMLGNLLIVLFTLGLGYPIVLHRDARLLARTLLASGAIDPETLRQSTERASALGEGMFQALDASGGML